VTPDVLPEARVDAAKASAVPGMHLELHPVREFADESLAAFLVGVVGYDGRGALAAEKVLNGALAERDGRFTFIRDAAMRPLWIEPDGWKPPEPGADVRLSIDLALQAALYEELYRGVQDANAQGGRGILLDPATGEVLAVADIVRSPLGVVDYDWKTVIPKDKGPGGPRYRTVRGDPARVAHPALAHNRCVEDVYEPGSTFKPFMWAAVSELGLAQPAEPFDTGGGHYRTPYGRQISDVVKRDTMTWAQVLVNSSNIGMTKGTARMSFRQMRDAVLKFGFGSLSGIGLPGETRGLVTSAKAWSNYTQTSVAMGHEVAVTPVQMARAFSVFARSGPESGTLPRVTLLAARGGTGQPAGTAPGAVPVLNTRVLPQRIADLTRETMRGVTAKLDENMLREYNEGGWRHEIFGKSGTAEIPLGQPPEGQRRPRGSDGYFTGQYNSSFIAAGPVENPRLVCLIVIDDPGPELIPKKRHYGAWVAGPVVRRVMERALTYMGVPASVTPGGRGEGHAGD
jgi:cell division protein FtsI (penicillin-binding protein 3)